jgi:hypothetical protein
MPRHDEYRSLVIAILLSGLRLSTAFQYSANYAEQQYSKFSITWSPLSAHFSTELGRDRVIAFRCNSATRRLYAGDRVRVKTPKTKQLTTELLCRAFSRCKTYCRNILCHAWVLSEEVNGMCGTCRQYVDAI